MIDAQAFNRARERCGTYCDYSGIRVTRIEPGYCESECRLERHHMNPGGGVHGGLLFTMLDTTGCCAAGAMEGGRRTLVTQSASIYYLRPVWEGTLRAVARRVKEGRNVGVVTVDIFCGDILAARGEVSVFYTSETVSDKVEDYFPALKGREP